MIKRSDGIRRTVLVISLMVVVDLDLAGEDWREQNQPEESRAIVFTINGHGASKQGMVDSRSSMYFAGKLTR